MASHLLVQRKHLKSWQAFNYLTRPAAYHRTHAAPPEIIRAMIAFLMRSAVVDEFMVSSLIVLEP